MRRDPTFWTALAVAFVLGLLPGLALMAYQRRSIDRSAAGTREELQARQRTWNAERADLTQQLASAETSVARLEAQLASVAAQVARLESSSDAEEPGTAPKKPPVIVERSVEGTTTPGKDIRLVVKVEGDADKVTMRIAKVDPDSGWVKTYVLKDTGVSGGVHVWKTTVPCPDTPGEYRFFADAYLGSTHVSMPGISAWTFLVE